MKKYKEYLLEVKSFYGLKDIEIQGIFLCSVAKAYAAVHSAYVWEDGTVSVVKKDKNNKKYSIANYVVSKVMYEKIVNIFIEDVKKYSQKRDEIKFTKDLKEKIVKVTVTSTRGEVVSLKPILCIGGFTQYNFLLKHSDAFKNENTQKGNTLEVVLKKIGENIVYVSRWDKRICKRIFEEKYAYINGILKEVYDYKSVDVFLDKKSKKVFYFIDWKKEPNSYFKSVLDKEVKKVIKNSEILIKTKG